jgi:site-specific DNA recombinase
MNSGRELKAAIYARVSSDKQAEAGTIASQVEALRERVRESGMPLEEEFCFIDEGYSGATLVRPALERLRDLAAAGAIDRLYVHSPDRLARKYAYQILLLDELRQCGIEVIFLNHQSGRDPEGELLLQVQGVVAEYERAKILERCRRGRLHAARQGSVNVLSGAPYGYLYIAAGQGGGAAEYRVHLEEAGIVRQIYEWVGRDRLTIGEVGRRLKKQAVPSPKGKGTWTRGTIWSLLKNPAYKGTAAFGKTKLGERRPRLRPQRGSSEHPRRAYSTYDTPSEDWTLIAVPALVSEDLFTSVQEQLAENRQRARQHRRGASWLLQGLIVCRRCGYALYGRPINVVGGATGKRRSYAYYRCIGTDANRFDGSRICTNKPVRTDLLEEAVWADVCALLKDPTRIEEEFQRRLKETDVDQEELARTAQLAQKVKRSIGRLIDAYSDGLLEKSEFEPRMRKAKERLAILESDLDAVEEERQQCKELKLVLTRVEEFSAQLREGLEKAAWATRREVVRSLVKRVEVDVDQVRVVYRVDPRPSTEPSSGVLQHCRRRQPAGATDGRS